MKDVVITNKFYDVLTGYTSETLEGSIYVGTPNVCERSLSQGCTDFLVAEDGGCFILLRLFPDLQCIQ